MRFLWIAGAVVVVAALIWLVVNHRKKLGLLLPTLLGSIGAFLLVAGSLFVMDAGAPKHEAVKTGGLAGGAIVALYALWLNDRRRRTDEDRQDIERRRQDLEDQRAEHDRSRVADERFARAIELLGHETDQVRVGALHALAGLARSRHEYTQTVLDVLCAYLRRPFEFKPKDEASDRELEVRLTAQRLIADLLPHVSEVDAPHYNLNLTKARLEYFDISERQVGDFIARVARFHESNSLHHTHIHGDAWFTDAVSAGRLYAHNMLFHRKAWFSRFTAEDFVDFTNTEFRGENKFADATFHRKATFEGGSFAQPVDFRNARFQGGLDLRLARSTVARTHAMYVSLRHQNELPNGWVVDQRDDETGLVRS